MKDKQTLRDTLSVVNEWTNNCDVKVSILLAIFGVVFSVFLSSDYIKVLLNILEKCFVDISMFKILYMGALLILLGAIITGFWKLIRVLLPTINTDEKSLMFFGGISDCGELAEYTQEVENYSEDDVCMDLIYQIHSAANICTQKFKNQRIGLYCLTISSFLFAVWYIVGYFAIYIK